ncbi:MAG TPA: hypothetical protein VMF50_09155 [Candidatus Binataceae bacterium]|nr:hypothetical protein [Candidatus Binataceae bacterium]
MKACLDENRILGLILAEPGDDAGHAHLGRCVTCSTVYRKLLTDTRLITQTLDSTARAVMTAPRRAPVPSLHHRYRLRRDRPTILIASAAVFAGAIAAAFMLMLPAIESTITSRAVITAAKTAAPQASSVTAAALSARSPYMLWQRQSGVIITDPSEDLGYHEAVAGTASYQDLFFCVPQDDGTFCTSSAEQG